MRRKVMLETLIDKVVNGTPMESALLVAAILGLLVVMGAVIISILRNPLHAFVSLLILVAILTLGAVILTGGFSVPQVNQNPGTQESTGQTQAPTATPGEAGDPLPWMPYEGSITREGCDPITLIILVANTDEGWMRIAIDVGGATIYKFDRGFSDPTQASYGEKECQIAISLDVKHPNEDGIPPLIWRWVNP